MFKEFRDFTLQGNIFDLAVGVIIGATFNRIVASLVGDIITPTLSAILNQSTNLTDFFVTLNGQSYLTLQAARDAGAPVLAYGAFITSGLDFLLTALALFILVKMFNRLKHSAAPSKEEKLLTEIRDLLKHRAGGRFKDKQILL